LDRHLIALRALEWLTPDGAVAIANTGSVWADDEPWQAVAVEVIRRWTGVGGRPASVNAGEPRQPHEACLADAGFARVEEHHFEVDHVRSLDSFIGYLYSTSVVAAVVRAGAAAGSMRSCAPPCWRTTRPAGTGRRYGSPPSSPPAEYNDSTHLGAKRSWRRGRPCRSTASRSTARSSSTDTPSKRSSSCPTRSRSETNPEPAGVSLGAAAGSRSDHDLFSVGHWQRRSSGTPHPLTTIHQA